MRSALLQRYLRVPLSSAVRSGDQVVIVTDPKVELSISEAAAAVVEQLGATPYTVIIPPPAAYGNEPPALVAEMIRKANVAVMACSTAMTHTDAVRGLLEAGGRYVALGGASFERLTEGAATADYEFVSRITHLLAEVLTGAKEVHVTTEAGTDLRFSLEGRKAIPLTGMVEPGKPIAGFPSGEVATAPVEGTGEGVVVVDGSMHHIGRVRSPIRITMQGRAVEIQGASEAADLRRLLEEHGDENSLNLAEFAIGTNPKARLSGHPQEEKKVLGSSHVAFGDNRTLGGTVYSKTHLDGMVLNPTVVVDGRVVVERGKLRHEIS